MFQTICYTVMAGVFAYGVYDKIRYKDTKGFSVEYDITSEFSSFYKRCKDKETASIIFFLPTVPGSCSFSFLYNIKIKGNEKEIEEALKTNNFRKIVKKKEADFKKMDLGHYEFNSAPYSNWFILRF